MMEATNKLFRRSGEAVATVLEKDAPSILEEEVKGRLVTEKEG